MFFRLLDYLDLNFDEEWLRLNYLPSSLRCMSSVQSYNIYDSKEYYDAYGNNWLARAEMILKNPNIMDNEPIKSQSSLKKVDTMEQAYREDKA